MVSPYMQAAAQCYVDLIIKESDNNVKLIVLDRLIGLKSTSSTHEKILQVHNLFVYKFSYTVHPSLNVFRVDIIFVVI